MGRVTEFVHFMNRTDIGLGQNPKPRDYVYWTPWTKHKRWRYEYQKWLRELKKEKGQK